LSLFDPGIFGGALFGSAYNQQQQPRVIADLEAKAQLRMAAGLVNAQARSALASVELQEQRAYDDGAYMIGARLEGPDLLEFEAGRLLDAADELEKKVEAHECEIRRRWKIRQDSRWRVKIKAAKAAKFGAEVEKGLFEAEERDRKRERAQSARCPSGSPFDRDLPGDDIAPPADVELLIRKDELLEKIGVPVGSEYRWCFAEKMAQYSQPEVDHCVLHCACTRGNYLKDVHAFSAPMEIHTVVLSGHTVRLDNGHLRIVYLGRCDGCGRVHWFEVAREVHPNEIDNSVVVYCDPRNGKTCINGAWFTAQELALRRTSW